MPRSLPQTYRAPPASFYARQRRETSPGIGFGIGSDITRMQKVFPEVFAAWLKDNFESKEHIALFFCRDERSARNWLSGLNCPTGPVAAAIILRSPDLRQKLIERMAA